jgi:hypothetical protein
MSELIPLQSSHITQHTNGHIKSEWSVELNMTDERILLLPSKYSDTEVFHIMDFAKKYELEALNIGIQHGKSITVEVYDKKLEDAGRVIEYMKAENEKLAMALEKLYMENVVEI